MTLKVGKLGYPLQTSGMDSILDQYSGSSLLMVGCRSHFGIIGLVSVEELKSFLPENEVFLGFIWKFLYQISQRHVRRC